MSPDLFLICAKVLSSLLNKGVQDGLLSGVKASFKGPKISNLFFADDSLLFGKAMQTKCQNIKDILGTYELASGQKIYAAKTNVFFSSNTTPEMKVLIMGELGAGVCNHHKKYLGLPSFIGRSKKHRFQAIKEKVWSKIQG